MAMARLDPKKPRPAHSPTPPQCRRPHGLSAPVSLASKSNVSDSGQITVLPPPQRPVQPLARSKLLDASVDLEAGSPWPGLANEKEKEPLRKQRRDSDGGRNVAANGYVC